jgi:hypothetical protein
MVLPLVAAAPYITGGIATLGAGLYAAQPYIQKAVDNYINRSVTPTGEGGIVDAYPGTQTGLQDWTTAYGQDELPPGTLGYVEGVHGPKSKATEELEEMMKKPPIHHPPPEFKIPPTEIPQEEKWTPPVSPPIEVPTTETFPLPEQKTMEDYIVYSKDPTEYLGEYAKKKALKPEAEEFWEKTQDLEIYKGKDWADLDKNQRGEFYRKYKRFVDKGIPVDDVTISGDRKRIQYPTTYTTKSKYPVIKTKTDPNTGKRIRGEVSFNHLEDPAGTEEAFKGMVEQLYQYPMNSKNIPDELKVDKFNNDFFNNEQSDDYVNQVIKRYATANIKIDRPEVGTEQAAKDKLETRNSDIKENGNYFYETKIKGSNDIDLHHTKTIKTPYSADDLAYIEDNINQKELSEFEYKRTALLKSQKKALEAYQEEPSFGNKKEILRINKKIMEIIGNETTYGIMSAPIVNFDEDGDVFLSEFKFTKPDLKRIDQTGILQGKTAPEWDLLDMVLIDFNRPMKRVVDAEKNNKLIKIGGDFISNKEFVESFEDPIEGPLDASIDYIVNRQTVFGKDAEPVFKEQAQEWLRQNPGKNSNDALAAVKAYIKQEAIKRMQEYGVIQTYKKGGRVGFKYGGTEFDALVEMYMKEHGMERRDAVTEALRDLGKLKKGGRVGYKEGGSVKPKINPIDYIVNYSDGTKLYKINSFIRDIARQIDY